MLRDNANTNGNNFQQHGSSIRQLKNKLFTDEKVTNVCIIDQLCGFQLCC